MLNGVSSTQPNQYSLGFAQPVAVSKNQLEKMADTQFLTCLRNPHFCSDLQASDLNDRGVIRTFEALRDKMPETSSKIAFVFLKNMMRHHIILSTYDYKTNKLENSHVSFVKKQGQYSLIEREGTQAEKITHFNSLEQLTKEKLKGYQSVAQLRKVQKSELF